MNSTRLKDVQVQITQRCIDLSGKKAGLVLDVGCGTGFSYKTIENNGFRCVGIDISYSMLKVCNQPNLVNHDIGRGLPFAPGTFDLVISVSCLQWLFQSYESTQVPIKRIKCFFRDMYSILKSDGVGVLQFYCSEKQVNVLKSEASNAGFDGSLVIDKPNTRNEKKFLLLRCQVAKSIYNTRTQPRKKTKNSFEECGKRSKYSGRKRCKR